MSLEPRAPDIDHFAVAIDLIDRWSMDHPDAGRGIARSHAHAVAEWDPQRLVTALVIVASTLADNLPPETLPAFWSGLSEDFPTDERIYAP